ncbi:hypothetical protein [uncultured Sphingomonas sp.]|uniref:hypothetical protein n=1 Tax=uncultured Sphingomonas sp. TaxID=158754 RepID=UPI0025E38A14|nr:hypothetical protein [uncultured Sphingomonas sp.]
MKVLLESGALILRGAIRRRYPRAGLTEVRADAGVLRLRCEGEVVALHLGKPAAGALAHGDPQAAPDVRQRLPIWAVYPKGKAAAFGDGAIRTASRSAGYRDSKSCSVSALRTATRYHPARG